MVAHAKPTPLATRLTQIAVMLATDKVVRTKDLQERFGVSRRTIARDVKAVREAGLNVVYDSQIDTFRLVDVEF